MFKSKLLKKVALTFGLSLLAIGSVSITNVKAATTSSNTETNQMFPVDYVDQYLAGIQTNLTIPSYELPAETDGYWRTYDQFLSDDMTTWLGSANLAYAKKARNNNLTKYFEYRLAPADDDWSTFPSTTIPELKKNGGTANLKLQVLNVYNAGQVLRELPITVTVPTPMSELDVNYNATATLASSISPEYFKQTTNYPKFTITDKDTGKVYQASKITPVDSVYIDGTKTAISSLPNTLKSGTYTQSIYFSVAGMSTAELSQLATNSRIVGNDGSATIRYSGGQLIATRTVIVP